MDLTHGSIRKQLLIFSFPIILTMILQQTYSLVDTMIVSHYCQMEDLSAISISSSLYSFLLALLGGFGIGCSIMAGKAYGRGQGETLKNTLYTLLVSGALFSLLLALCCLGFAKPFLYFVQTPKEIFATTTMILRLYTGGILFYGIAMIGSSLLNGLGQSRKTFLIFSTSGCLNLILDWVAVVVFQLGVLGTVYASLVAQFYSFALILICLKQVAWQKEWHFLKNIVKESIDISTTSMLQNALGNGLMVFLQTLINGYGITYINGYTAGILINSIFTIGVNGYCSGYSTFLSQNYGAKQWERIQQARCISSRDGTLACLLLGLTTLLLARPLSVAMLTAKDGESVRFGTWLILVGIPNYFLLLHTQRISFLFKNFKLNQAPLVSSLMMMFVKIVSVLVLLPHSLYLLPFTEILSKSAALLYLLLVQKKKANILLLNENRCQ